MRHVDTINHCFRAYLNKSTRSGNCQIGNLDLDRNHQRSRIEMLTYPSNFVNFIEPLPMLVITFIIQ
jgi:hypothetical protein